MTLLSRIPLDTGEVDFHYGTSLSQLPIENILIQSSLLEWLSNHGVPVTLARYHYLMRVAKKRSGEFDLACSACNEPDFGTAGIDYVHYPWNAYPRPETLAEWNQRPLLRKTVQLYNWMCRCLSGFSQDRPQNLTLANSQWTRELYREVYPNKACFVLNPPALAKIFPDAREPRRQRFYLLVGFRLARTG